MILHKKQNPENVAYFKSVLAEERLQ
jgi:hypothetical protein